jgi:four helix bundle protein
MAGFEELDVWKRAVELSAQVYRELSAQRDFGYRDQITRSGLSIPSNIAEGMERASRAEQCRFLNIARASCGEFRTQAIVGHKAGLIIEATCNTWCRESRELSAMLSALIRSIRGKRQE